MPAGLIQKMEPTALFGKLPRRLILPSEEAQYELYRWYQALHRRLEELWGRKCPRRLPRRSRLRWSGRRLAEANKLCRELYAVSALYTARGGYLAREWTTLPSTPTQEAVKAQLRVLHAFDRLLHAFVHHLASETTMERDRALQKATEQCEAVYKHYWNGIDE